MDERRSDRGYIIASRTARGIPDEAAASSAAASRRVSARELRRVRGVRASGVSAPIWNDEEREGAGGSLSTGRHQWRDALSRTSYGH